MRATPSPAILAVLRECLTYFRGTLYIQHTCERPRVSATTAFDHAHLAPELLVLGLERDSRHRQPFVHRGILQREYLARRVPPIDLIVRYSM